MPRSIDVLTSSSAPAWPTALMPLKSPLPSPNVMVPKQSFETRRPVLPSVAYSMAYSFLVKPKSHWREGVGRWHGRLPFELARIVDLVGGVRPLMRRCRHREGSPGELRSEAGSSAFGQGMTVLLLSIVRYCPWLTSTSRHAAESFGRFSLRQARMVKSPWSSSLRQKRCTSGVQAFSSCSEPLCARALVETGTDSSMSAKKNLCIVIAPSDFHHSDGHNVGTPFIPSPSHGRFRRLGRSAAAGRG